MLKKMRSRNSRKPILQLIIVLIPTVFLGILLLTLFLPWKVNLYFVRPLQYKELIKLSQQYNFKIIYVGTGFEHGTREVSEFIFIDTELTEDQFKSMVLEKRKAYLSDIADSAKLVRNAPGFKIDDMVEGLKLYTSNIHEKQTDLTLIYQAQVIISRHKLWKLTRENPNMIERILY